jgi:hypothetical protein
MVGIEVSQQDAGLGRRGEACCEQLGDMLWVLWRVEVQQREGRFTNGDDHLQKRVAIGEALHGWRATPHIRHALWVEGGGVKTRTFHAR